MTEFKVGDEVTLSTRGGARATVEYGPFDGEDVYVVKLVEPPADPDAKRTFTALAGIMAHAPKFAVGDRVEKPATGVRPGEIVAGPFTTQYDDVPFWVVEHDNGRVSLPREDGDLKKIEEEPTREIKVGDRVRVTDDDCGGRRFGGKIGTVKTVHRAGTLLPYLVEFGDGKGHHGDPNGRWNCRAVELVDEAPADTHTVDGTTYDLSARYRDRDGDVWYFKRFGDKVVGLIGSAPRTSDDGDEFSFAYRYRPLIKIDD